MKYLSHLAAALFHLAVVDAAKVFLKKKLGKVTSKSEASQEPAACSTWKQELADNGDDDEDAWCVSITGNDASEWNDAMSDEQLVPTAAQATGDPDPDAIECCTTPSPSGDDATDAPSSSGTETETRTCTNWQSAPPNLQCGDNQEFMTAANAGQIEETQFGDTCCEESVSSNPRAARSL
mmetsp:Transcript_26147/g.65893  ORF Transcript_26147/g.65893 Transcript_26147/m.65893 type:complete len:180 (+) Transcript_26147:86-625(+)